MSLIEVQALTQDHFRDEEVDAAGDNVEQEQPAEHQRQSAVGAQSAEPLRQRAKPAICRKDCDTHYGYHRSDLYQNGDNVIEQNGEENTHPAEKMAEAGDKVYAQDHIRQGCKHQKHKQQSRPKGKRTEEFFYAVQKLLDPRGA